MNPLWVLFARAHLRMPLWTSPRSLCWLVLFLVVVAASGESRSAEPEYLCIDGDCTLRQQQDWIDVVYCVDGDYVEGLGASINSIITNTNSPHRLRLNILTSEDDAPLIRLWLQLLEGMKPWSEDITNTTGKTHQNPSRFVIILVDFISGPFFLVRVFDTKLVAGKYTSRTHGGGPLADGARINRDLNFARFYLHLYFPHLRKFVYADADTIIQRDISQLFDASLLDVERQDKESQEQESKVLERVVSNSNTTTRRTSLFALAAFNNCQSNFERYFNLEHPWVKALLALFPHLFLFLIFSSERTNLIQKSVCLKPGFG